VRGASAEVATNREDEEIGMSMPNRIVVGDLGARRRPDAPGTRVGRGLAAGVVLALAGASAWAQTYVSVERNLADLPEFAPVLSPKLGAELSAETRRRIVARLSPDLRLVAAIESSGLAGVNHLGGPVLVFDTPYKEAEAQVLSAAGPVLGAHEVVPIEEHDFDHITGANLLADLATIRKNADLWADSLKLGAFETCDYLPAGDTTPGFTSLPPATALPSALVREIVDLEELRRAEPNYKFAGAGPATFPNEFTFQDMPGLENIRAPDAWSQITDSGMTVAVIDTGIDYRHPDLAANMWRSAGQSPRYGHDFYEGDADPLDEGEFRGHGTSVAGVIGAVGNNGLDVAGVAWAVKLMAIRVAEGTTAEHGWDANDIACGIYFAIANGAEIINASFSGPNDAEAVRDAVDAAETAERILVAAAGNARGVNDELNNDAQRRYPGSYPNGNVIAVLSIDPEHDRLSDSTHFGRSTVHLGAPGEYIPTTFPDADAEYDVTRETGTSIAAPHVSGALALTWAKYPGDSWQQVRHRVLANGRPLPSLTGKTRTGCTLDLSFLGDAPLEPRCPVTNDVPPDPTPRILGTYKLEHYGANFPKGGRVVSGWTERPYGEPRCIQWAHFRRKGAGTENCRKQSAPPSLCPPATQIEPSPCP
jgi:subtilisin family serine protease